VFLFIFMVPALWACSDDPIRNTIKTPMPDEGLPDLAVPDGAISDLAAPDQAGPDLLAPDQAVPDLPPPDQAIPDLPVPDIAAPDQAIPDMLPLDVMPWDDVMPWPDVMPQPDMGKDSAASDGPVYLDGAGPDAAPACKLTVQKTLTFVNGVASTSGEIKSTDKVSQVGMTASGCTKKATPGAEHLYTVTLKANTKYTVLVTHSTSYDAAVYVFSACGQPQGSCVLGRDANAHAIGFETGNLTTTTGGKYYIGVDSLYAAAGNPLGYGTYSLAIMETSTAIPPHDVCAKIQQPLTIPAGKTELTHAGDTSLAKDDVNLSPTSCTKNTTAGPDLFYKLNVTAGHKYVVTLDGAGWNESLYLFSNCANVAGTCSPYMGSDASTSAPEQAHFYAKTSGAFYIGVDGRAAADKGLFTLHIKAIPLEQHNTCANAKALTFTGTKAKVSSSTDLAVDTLDLTSSGCTGKSTQGPDLFYSAPLSGNLLYKVSLTPAAGYDAALYILSKCGTSSCVVGADAGVAGEEEVIVFKPPATGTYIIGVDTRIKGTSTAARGKFTLTVDRFSPLYGETCTKPLPLLMIPPWTKVQTSGNTTGYTNTLNIGGFKHGGATAPSTGGNDMFFTLPVTKNYYYAAIVKPKISGFTPVTFALTNCSSPATSFLGWGSSAGSAKAGSFAFKAAASGVVLVGVDGLSSGQKGSFTLDLWQGLLAANDTCAKAKAVTLVSGKATVSGSKFAATSSLSKCGSSLLAASDLFYKFTPVKGKTYKFTFKPTGNNGYFGVWDGAHACDPTKVATQCGAAGGYIMVTNGSSGTKTFKSTSGDIYFVVDGASAAYDVYDFTVAIEQVP